MPDPAHATGTTLTIDLDAVVAKYRLLGETPAGADCAAVRPAAG